MNTSHQPECACHSHADIMSLDELRPCAEALHLDAIREIKRRETGGLDLSADARGEVST
jgi:hypothetical protein